MNNQPVVASNAGLCIQSLVRKSFL